MKNIAKILAVAGIGLSLAACNKEKFHDPSFVSFVSNAVTATEDAGILKVPVKLYGAGECVVTYSVVDGTAKAGVNYEVVDRNGKADKSGVLTVNGADTIYVKITDLTGTETGNLTFNVLLNGTSEDGVHVGAFKNCKCTIVDNDGGLAKLLGSYAGSGTDSNGSNVTFDFTLEEYTPAANSDYPKANCQLTDGVMNFASNGNQMDFANPIYAYFDKTLSQLHLYGLQPFNQYNFGGDVGVCAVAWGNSATSLAELMQKSDIIIDAGSGSLTLSAVAMLWLLDPNTGEASGYTAGSLASGYTWTKK